MNALEKSGSIPAKEKERLRKELQKTEKTLQKKDAQLSAQARELEIETALEKVRSRSMAMQHTNDIGKVVVVFFDQLKHLNIPFEQAWITILHLESGYFDTWFSPIDEIYDKPAHFQMPSAAFEPTIKTWESGVPFAYLSLNTKEEVDQFMIACDELTKSNYFSHSQKKRKNHQLEFLEARHKYGFISKTTVKKPSKEDEDVLQRFGKVFEQTYTRFLDIKNAEALAREAQIEAALERVRTRTMAMHKSEELAETALVLYKQFSLLGNIPDRMSIGIFKEDSRKLELWPTDQSGSKLNKKFAGSWERSPIMIKIYKAWKAKDNSLVADLSGQDLKEWLKFIREEVKLFVDDSLIKGRRVQQAAFFSHGFLLFTTNEPIADEIMQLLMRFAGVFSQTYTRFLDLQKAEEQAREAQIEAALERVRSRSMAMLGSSEMLEVIVVVSEQLQQLNLNFNWVSFAKNKQAGDFTFWLASRGQPKPILLEVPTLDSPVLNRVYEAQKKEITFLADVFTAEENREWHEHLIKYSDLKYYPAPVKEFILNAPGFARSTFLLENIDLYVGNYRAIPFTEEENSIFKRFAQVFEQTYTRFLDLQKAEAQAREAQIEGALERVRTRTMAMHNTDDIAATVTAFFNELLGLGLGNTARSGIGILSQSEKMKLWTASVNDKSKVILQAGLLDMTIHPLLEGVKKAWQSGDPHFTYELSGEDKLTYFRAINKAPVYTMKIDLKKLPEIVYHYSFPFRDGSLFVFSDEPLWDDIQDIFKRFAAVFGQTYTRYLDLHKAEAQARKAQIEAALERVRSKTMAMHNSDDVGGTVVTLFDEVIKLGLDKSIRCGIGIFEGTEHLETWSATFSSTGKVDLKMGMLNLTVHPLLEAVKKAWKSEKTNYSYEFKGKDVTTYYTALNNEPNYPFHVELNTLPDKMFQKCFFFSEGVLFAHTENPISEEAAIVLNRFADVFGQTYRRYLDLQKAEAQAREAEIQLALERVRAKSLAMKSSNELHQVLSVLFRQFDHLGIKPVNVFLSLFDREERTLTYRASGKSGNRIPGKQVVEVDSMEALQALYDKWLTDNSDTVEVIYYPREVLPQLFGIFSETFSSMPKRDRIGVNDFPDGGYSMAGYTPYGYLGYDHQRQATEEEKDILSRFCVEFTRVYQRFLDIQKAEAQTREAQIEMALERVRSASMAMHKSKDLHGVLVMLYNQLASLGLKMHSAQIIESIDDFKEMHIWIVTNGVVYPEQVHAPFSKNIFFKRFREAVTNGESFYTLKFSKRQKDNLFHHFFDNTILRNAPQARKDLIFSSPGLGTSNAMGQYTSLSVMRYDGILYSEEENEIIKRFAKVLEQSYTRFLDIQKAETQAREAQIEAALEKVRSQSLAMHATSEMQQVANAVYDQLKELGLEMEAVGMSGVISAKQDYDVWVGGVPFGKALRIPYNENTKVQRDYNKMLEERPELFAKTYSGKDKEEYINHLLTHGDFPKALKKKMKTSETFTTSIALAKKSSIQILRYTNQPYSEEDNEILKRFSKVFEQAYIRFMDLEKAEAQARESQIEAALEKVRSRSLAMQKPSELQEVVAVVGDKLQELGVILDSGGVVICTYFPDSKDVMHWTATFDAAHPSVPYYLPYFDTPIWKETWASKWESDDDFFEKIFSFKDKNHFFHKAFEISDYKNLPEEHKKEILSVKTHALSFAWQTNSALMIPSHTGKLLPEEHKIILKRFARVFEQAYIRFMDLQKAEAQARESKIEMALERVRSRAMAMHHTDELTDVLGVLFNQFDFLGINPVLTHLTLFDEDNETFTLRITTGGEKRTIAEQLIDVNAVESWKTSFANWKKSELHAVDCIDYPPEVLPAVWEVLDGVMSALPEGQKIFPEDFPNGLYTTQGHCKYGYIGFNHSRRATEEEKEIVVRFAKEFGRLYQRFLDIQKAESQAREAQIEGALERVRSKAMAMHTSDDLADTVEILYKELDTLQVHALRFGHAKVNSDTKIVELHTATDLGKVVGQLKLEGHPLLEKIYEHYLAKEDLYYALQGEEMKSYYSIVGRAIDVPRPPMDTVQHGYFFFLGDTANYAYSDKALDEEELKVYRRLISVLNLTYKRYEELKNAENQAREAQIEGALERVRSKTMAMHNSKDLEDIVVSLFDEVLKLGLDKSIRCGIGILEGHEGMETRSVNSNSDGTVDLKVGMLNMTIHPMLVGLKKAWKNGRKGYSYEYKSKDVRKYYTALNNEPEYPFNADLKSLPKQEYHRSFFFSSGIIFAFSENPISEESSKILARFAAVFGQTYQRFLDLQKAEERAKDAVKQASLDRVRGQIASMRSAEDLERITPLVWNELTTLDIPFIRCGVFIIDDPSEKVQVHLSAPDGHSLGVMLMPFDADPLTSNMVENWRKAEVFRAHWNREQFTAFMQTMIDLGQIKNKKVYQGAEQPPKSLHLHFVPFTQGMLYVGSKATLTEEQIELVQSLADAFAIAYARYEDFHKLEKAKERVETTLSELKATQNQLVQSEKMASLGELTAGIAHEIQNPLNFVNNFSEVSVELIEEMLEEIEKGDVEEVKALAEDIIQNLEKINHHGKRADGIVKGMLQHSRASSGEKEPTDLNVLADEYLRLAYHGLRAKDKMFNATLETHFDESIGKVNRHGPGHGQGDPQPYHQCLLCGKG